MAAVPTGGEGGQGGAILAPYMEYPSCKKCHYVMQWHIRGKSVHTDWRMQVDDHLVGWTVDTPGGIDKTCHTVEEARSVYTINKNRFKAASPNVGFRAETKARQPKVWLTVEGVVKPGEVGATRLHPGVFLIIDRGAVCFGTQKPYFHEYFIKSNSPNHPFSKDWTRIVVRAVNVSVIDPETKLPKESKELMWRVLIPKEQEPYAISNRAMKKNWKPPKNYPYPFPQDWTKKNFSDQLAKWEAWKKGEKLQVPKKVSPVGGGYFVEEPGKPFSDLQGNPDMPYYPRDKRGTATMDEEPIKGEFDPNERSETWPRQLRPDDTGQWKDPNKDSIPVKSGYNEWTDPWEISEKPATQDYGDEDRMSLSEASYQIQLLTYQGQVVIRNVPHERWFLRIKQGNNVESWVADTDITRFSPVAMTYEGSGKRYWDFEGEIKPETELNPSKSLTAKMVMLAKGKVKIKDIEDEVREQELSFSGDFHGKFKLTQEEKKSNFFTLQKLMLELIPEQMDKTEFVLQEHKVKTEKGTWTHWDIRINKGFEFNIYEDPRELKAEGRGCKALYKLAPDLGPWMKIDKPGTKMMVGKLETWVTPLDKGTVDLIDETPPRFFSMQFNGEHFKGYYVYKASRGEEGGIFERARVPHPTLSDLQASKAAKGDYFKPFKVIKKAGWDYYWLCLYDQRDFTRCVTNPVKYIPALKNKPKEIQQVLVCIYSRPGTLPGARVSRLKISSDWDFKKAVAYVRDNNLHTWGGSLIRNAFNETPAMWQGPWAPSWSHRWDETPIRDIPRTPDETPGFAPVVPLAPDSAPPDVIVYNPITSLPLHVFRRPLRDGIAGFSNDKKHLYIDPLVPDWMIKGLITHESVEMLFTRVLGFSYEWSHEEATKAEQRVVLENGGDWAKYQDEYLRLLQEVETRHPKPVDPEDIHQGYKSEMERRRRHQRSREEHEGDDPHDGTNVGNPKYTQKLPYPQGPPPHDVVPPGEQAYEDDFSLAKTEEEEMPQPKKAPIPKAEIDEPLPNKFKDIQENEWTEHGPMQEQPAKDKRVPPVEPPGGIPKKDVIANEDKEKS